MIRLSGYPIIGSSRTLSPYFTRPLLTILLLGFSSGLPLALTGATLSFWLADAHVDIATIGLFAAVGIPYTLKFCWSPVLDSMDLPFLSRALGRRRGWILLTQLGLAAVLAALALTNPTSHPGMTALIAWLVAFMSASQDIVIDAYRVEILAPVDQGRGAAMAQLGYRLGMIVSGAGALYMASYIGWSGTYMAMAALLGIGMVATILAQEPLASAQAHPTRRSFKQWLLEAVIHPFTDFTRHSDWALILVFIVAYALADAFIGRMTNPFLHDIGFSKINVANVVKIYGTIATLLGAFIGGTLVARFGAIRILFVAGFLHALTNLLYVEQAALGANLAFLALSVTVENLSGGISAAAFVAYLSGLCNVHYTATQYALLSSLAAFGRTWLATPAGYVAKYFGWQWFFALSACLAAPGLLVLYVLNKRLNRASAPAHTHAAPR